MLIFMFYVDSLTVCQSYAYIAVALSNKIFLRANGFVCLFRRSLFFLSFCFCLNLVVAKILQHCYWICVAVNLSWRHANKLSFCWSRFDIFVVDVAASVSASSAIIMMIVCIHSLPPSPSYSSSFFQLLAYFSFFLSLQFSILFQASKYSTPKCIHI